MSDQVRQAIQVLREAAPDAFYVGGCVRDWLLGRPLKDLDVAVPSGVEEVGRRAADALGGVFFWLRREMNVGRVLVRGEDVLQIDVVPLVGSLEADLRRRDFTINAMAASTKSGLAPGAPIVDPTGGQYDLDRRLLRLAAPDALQRDPLRCLRAFRLRAALGLTIDPSVEPALQSAAPGLGRISGERIRDELFVLLEGEQTEVVMTDLLSHGLVAPWSPLLASAAAGDHPSETVVSDASGAEEGKLPSGIALVRNMDQWLERHAPALPFHGDLSNTLGTPVTPPRSRRALARLASLSVRAGPRAGEIARSLCLSVPETRVLTRAIAGAAALRQAWPSPGRARLQFFQRWEPGAVEAALIALTLVRTVPTALPASPSSHSINLLAELVERRLRPQPPLLTGDEVMRILNLAPGPEIGAYLQELEEHRADGLLQTAAVARDWLRERKQP